MDKIVVTGNGPLSGEIQISGAKNACLTLMPATLLSDGPLTLTNAPRLSDIRTMTTLLQSLGAEVTSLQDGKVLAMSSHALSSHRAEYDIVRKMRASNLVLGPLLARHGARPRCQPAGRLRDRGPARWTCISPPWKRWGPRIELRDGYLHAEAPGGRLKGAEVDAWLLPRSGPRKTRVMAATLAKGTTVLNNAAREPEIVDLVRCLRAMGAQIEGEGTAMRSPFRASTGCTGPRIPVVTDRIELGTYMLAPAIAGGEVELIGGRTDLIGSFVERLDEAEIEVKQTNRGIHVKRKNGRVAAVDVATSPFPGFPTDLQAQMMALMCTADGVSHLEETIFENRFMHAPELTRMGAKIDVSGGTATVTGVNKLRGAPVMATDLRASVSLILAGLAAEGDTVVNRVYHLDRGYERVEEKLRACGAKIERVSEDV